MKDFRFICITASHPLKINRTRVNIVTYSVASNISLPVVLIFLRHSGRLQRGVFANRWIESQNLQRQIINKFELIIYTL